ncbi:MAG TPA: monofunctional biosynthetic peptidoglycan transglycosylase [Steroidobacteraceae bacterium]|jgi:monofunctional biosynthetic peptidoglycan transglycosylase|nr:monofunctional biosynthetic peptidoglycan transglycosylase [Steroidobacteraceae bacterium]
MARNRPRMSRFVRTLLWVALSCGVLSIAAVLLLRWIDPPYSAYMAETQLSAWASRDSSYVFRHKWVDLAQISPNLPLAVVASEDQKFPEHWGFDVEAIEKAYELNQHSHRVHGASTISQQVAKNLYLWSGRSYIRKALEAYFTVLIESCWPKRRILEIYLNIAEFGYGTYGAEAAAQRFFHKPAARLTRSDAAVLAAVLPNPQRFSAAAPSRYILERREWILGQMQALGGPEMLDEIDAYPNRRR